MTVEVSEGKAHLRLRGCTKIFGGLTAVNSVDLEVLHGTITGLIGPNGAGKTTLLNLIAGTLPVTRGEIVLEEKVITNMKAFERAKTGIGRTFQIPKPFTAMSVLENVQTAALFGSGQKITTGTQVEWVDAVLEKTKLADRKKSWVTELNLAERKSLELAKALATRPSLLLLDEVMAGLNAKETFGVMKIVRDINESGVTVILVEHVMRITMEISQRIVVMHYGQKIAEGTPQVVVKDPAVIEAYFGRRYASRFGQ